MDHSVTLDGKNIIQDSSQEVTVAWRVSMILFMERWADLVYHALDIWQMLHMLRLTLLFGFIMRKL